MCCVLTGDADTAIQHGHALGGVCVPAGHFDSPSKIYIQRCEDLSAASCVLGMRRMRKMLGNIPIVQAL